MKSKIMALIGIVVLAATFLFRAFFVKKKVDEDKKVSDIIQNNVTETLERNSSKIADEKESLEEIKETLEEKVEKHETSTIEDLDDFFSDRGL